jgi:hypothetical protein
MPVYAVGAPLPLWESSKYVSILTSYYIRTVLYDVVKSDMV